MVTRKDGHRFTFKEGDECGDMVLMLDDVPLQGVLSIAIDASATKPTVVKLEFMPGRLDIDTKAIIEASGVVK